MYYGEELDRWKIGVKSEKWVISRCGPVITNIKNTSWGMEDGRGFTRSKLIR